VGTRWNLRPIQSHRLGGISAEGGPGKKQIAVRGQFAEERRGVRHRIPAAHIAWRKITLLSQAVRRREREGDIEHPAWGERCLGGGDSYKKDGAHPLRGLKKRSQKKEKIKIKQMDGGAG